jgi:hypothetical protein
MKKNNIKISKWLAIAGTLVVALIIMPPRTYALDNGTALLVQQSPVEGGTVTPETGVHKFESGSEVALVAVPKPGYQFIHWIGDVADSTSSRTTAYLDSPKIIIAVFERSEFEFPITDELADIRPGGGLYRNPADYSNQGGGGGGGGSASGGSNGWNWSNPQPQPNPNEDIPTPQTDTNDLPVPPPIPEPATILLLSLGCLGLARKRREACRQ